MYKFSFEFVMLGRTTAVVLVLGNSAHLNSDLYSRLQTLLIFVSKVAEKKDKNVISLFQKSEKSKKSKKNSMFFFEFKNPNYLT